ncbi:hypothetical protein [Spirosoma aerolatum]|uniref:hypothetical protein n=1 Tax=Spirosoma aerolatum TaxID=1211326 RepID=UPI0009AD0EC2|nr:hypothetical protein [Spirosoma aerolatum]
MRGATYYVSVDTAKLYATPAITGAVLSTLKKFDEVGVSTGQTTTVNGDQWLELVRLSDQKKVYALLSTISMNPAYGGNTLPDVTVTATKSGSSASTSMLDNLQTTLKQKPALAYGSLGVLMLGIGLLIAKLK